MIFVFLLLSCAIKYILTQNDAFLLLELDSNFLPYSTTLIIYIMKHISIQKKPWVPFEFELEFRGCFPLKAKLLKVKLLLPQLGR